MNNLNLDLNLKHIVHILWNNLPFITIQNSLGCRYFGIASICALWVFDLFKFTHPKIILNIWKYYIFNLKSFWTRWILDFKEVTFYICWIPPTFEEYHFVTYL